MKKYRSQIKFLVVIVMLSVCANLFALIKSPPAKAILPNGMRIIVVEDKSIPTVGLALMFKPGHFSKKFDSSGVENLVNYMMKTSDLNDETRFDLNARLEQEGILMEFGHSQQSISVGCQGNIESLEQMINSIGKVAFELKPSKELFGQAKENASSRLRMVKRYPLATGYLDKQVWNDLFPQLRTGMSQITSEDKLAGLSFEDYQEFYHEKIVPNNAVLVIVGDVDSSEIFKNSMKLLGKYVATQVKNEIKENQKEKTLEALSNIQSEFLDIKKTQVVVGFEAPSITDPDMPAAMLWHTAISDINESWLKTSFSKDFPELEDLSALYIPASKKGIFLFRFSSKEPDVDRAITTLLASLNNLYINPPRHKELRNLTEIKQLEGLEAREFRLNRAYELGLSELQSSYRIFDGINSSFQRVSSDDLKRVAEKMFSGKKYSVRIAYPLEFQKAEEQTVAYQELSNGLKVIVRNYPGSEIAGVALRIGINTCETDAKKLLLMRLVGEMIEIFINDKENTRLSRRLDEIGAKLEASIAEEEVIIKGKTQKKNLPKLIKLVRKILSDPDKDMAPRFFKMAKSKLLKKMEENSTDPTKKIYAEVSKRLFPGLNFSKLYDPIDEKAMEKLQFKDIHEFFSKWAVAPNVQLAVVGNFSVKQIAKVVMDEFADYSKGDGSLSTLTACPDWVNRPLEKTIIDEIKLQENSDKSVVLVAYRMKKFIDVKNRDELRQSYGANSVLGHILFYSRNSILSSELKKNGIEAQVGGMYRTTRNFSIFSFYVVVPTDKLDKSVEIIKKVVKDIPEMKVSKSDIVASGKWTKSLFNRYLEGSDAQAGLMVSYLGYGLSQDFLNELLSIYQSVTIEDVKRAAKENFNHYLMLIEKH